MIEENKFNFWIPAEIEKAKDKKGNEIMRVKGVASTPDRDSEDEELIPMGFQLDRFLKTGQINWNHQSKSDPSKIIGEPEVAKITPKGELYIEGFLYPNSDLAKSVWKLAETLEKNSKTRKLGWSIEGRAIERDITNPKKITKALITGVAITPTPVNASTYLDLVKGEQKEDYIELDFQDDILKKSELSDALYEFKVGSKNYIINKSFQVEEKEDDIEKQDEKRDEKIARVMKEFKEGKLKNSSGEVITDRKQAIAIAMSEAGISKEKSMDVASEKPLMPESLDKKPKVLEPELKKAILKGIMPNNILMKILKRF
jgi:hypothetical protein